MVKKKKAHKAEKVDTRYLKKWHANPLKSSFMILAMVGFLISAYYIFPMNIDYGVSFMIVFAAMFIASLISMTKAPVVE